MVALKYVEKIGLSEKKLENVNFLLMNEGILGPNFLSLPKKEATKKKVAALRWVKRSLPNVKMLRVNTETLLCDPLVFHSEFCLHLTKKEAIRSKQIVQLSLNIEKGKATKNQLIGERLGEIKL